MRLGKGGLIAQMKSIRLLFEWMHGAGGVLVSVGFESRIQTAWWVCVVDGQAGANIIDPDSA